MEQYISKSALIAELEKRIKVSQDYAKCNLTEKTRIGNHAQQLELNDILAFLDTIEVKEVEEKFECPNIKVKDSVEVSSRMSHIDKSLLPIVEFIMDYCSWNLHKDEWNQPVIEVPLFRVLDALVQKGKPYCEG